MRANYIFGKNIVENIFLFVEIGAFLSKLEIINLTLKVGFTYIRRLLDKFWLIVTTLPSKIDGENVTPNQTARTVHF